MAKTNDANVFIKLALVGSLIIGLYVLNLNLFDLIFNPDYDLVKNYGYSTWFSFSMVALEVAIYRIVTGKLKIKITFN